MIFNKTFFPSNYVQTKFVSKQIFAHFMLTCIITNAFHSQLAQSTWFEEHKLASVSKRHKT